MTKETLHYCDVCGRELPVLGGRCSSGNTSTYKLKRTVWSFFSRWLAWQPERVEWEEICGDCYERIKDAAREGEA